MLPSFRTPLLVVTGAALGIGLILACGDDSPTDADAAVCDCPAAEPPLAGRIILSDESTSPIPALGSTSQSNECPTGATLLSGSCLLETIDNEVTLSQSGFEVFDDTVWVCRWNNPTSQANVGKVRVICLMPAE